ncbi:hypothetical protein PIB30_021661 [Stylosanthes scabra]|uniref:PB1-like domain-containing protein n=1 Tax=Stylosanthes scabra TaxID=79078 RepID=A0ABU6Y655_9FABA|nr:hypothetical protein [Stylosanthes scabra]
MVYFDIVLFHRGHFGYIDGEMRYVGGEKLTIGDNDSDFWSVFEADEKVRRLGDDDVAAMWYKDPSIANMSIGLRMFLEDSDALEMVRIAQLRGHVELFVVHDDYPEEGFPEIGYIDVGGGPAREDDGAVLGAGQNEEPAAEADPPNGGNGEGGAGANGEGGTVIEEGEGVAANGEGEAVITAGGAVYEEVDGGGVNENEEGVGVDAAPSGEKEGNDDVGPNLNREGAGANQGGEASVSDVVENEIDGSDDEDSDDAEYVPSCDEAESVDDVQFTDSEEEFDLEDNFFGVETGKGKKGADDKGKGVVNEDFNDIGEDSEDLEGV